MLYEKYNFLEVHTKEKSKGVQVLKPVNFLVSFRFVATVSNVLKINPRSKKNAPFEIRMYQI